jgi:hypothetical protein
MSLGNSNTYVAPQSTKAISLARIDWNNSIRAVFQNFYSEATPTSTNITIDGVTVTPLDGMLYHSARTGRLYVKSSSFDKGNPVHSGFTRNGIGPFVEEGLATANVSTYEVGELFAVHGSNARVYMKTNNSGAIVDIGLPVSNSIVNTMMRPESVTYDKIALDAVKFDKMQELSAEVVMGAITAGNPVELSAKAPGRAILASADNVAIRDQLGLSLGRNAGNVTLAANSRMAYQPIQLQTGSGSLSSVQVTGNVHVYTNTGGHTLTLPAANASGGTHVVMFKHSGVAGTLQVSAAGSDTIEFGAVSTSNTKLGPGDFVALLSDGTSKWYPLNDRKLETVTGHIDASAGIDIYYLIPYAWRAGTVRQFYGITDSGTTTVTARNGGNPITWGVSGTSISFTSAGQTYTASAGHLFGISASIDLNLTATGDDFRFSMLIDYDF